MSKSTRIKSKSQRKTGVTHSVPKVKPTATPAEATDPATAGRPASGQPAVPLVEEMLTPTAPVPPKLAAKIPLRAEPSCFIPTPPRNKVDEKIRELIGMIGTHPDQDLIEDIIDTALRLVKDGAPRNELKLIAGAVRELRYAFNVFRQYQSVRKVSVFGSARTPADNPEYLAARKLSQELVRQNFMVITGAGPGIMEAAQGGAGRDHSFGVNIRLPFEQSANPVIAGDKKLISFRYFFTRKVCFLKEASAIVLFPGGFGTHDEGFEALTLIQTGKTATIPVVFVDMPGGTYWRKWADYVAEHLLGKRLIAEEDMNLFAITDDSQWAVDHIVQFYSRYHSSRIVKDKLVLRMVSKVPDAALERLNRQFKAMLVGSNPRIEQRGPLPEEADQPELAQMPRLVMPFNRRSYGRLRMLIDEVNRA